MHRVDTETLSKIEVVNAARRPLLAYAALVMENLVREIKPKEVVISALGVREGLLYSLLKQAERARDPLIRPPPISTCCARARRITARS